MSETINLKFNILPRYFDILTAKLLSPIKYFPIPLLCNKFDLCDVQQKLKLRVKMTPARKRNQVLQRQDAKMRE